MIWNSYANYYRGAGEYTTCGEQTNDKYDHHFTADLTIYGRIAIQQKKKTLTSRFINCYKHFYYAITASFGGRVTDLIQLKRQQSP